MIFIEEILLKMSFTKCQQSRFGFSVWYDTFSLINQINLNYMRVLTNWHDDVIKWKKFSRYWPLVRGIHRSPVNSPHKGQWRGALMIGLIRALINSWVNNGEAGDLKRHCAHCDVIGMEMSWRMYASVYWGIIGSFNGSSPVRCQAIVWTNEGLLLIGQCGRNLNNDTAIFMQNMCLKSCLQNVSHFVWFNIPPMWRW